MASDQARELRQQGIAAAKAGQKAQARQLLQQSIRLEPQNEAAWLWLATVVDERRERLFCLSKLLAINPNNEMGLKALQQMGVTPEELAQQSGGTASPTPAQLSQPQVQTAPGVPVPDPQRLAEAQQQVEALIREYLAPVKGYENVTWVHKTRRRAGERDALYLRAYLAGGALGFLFVIGLIGFVIVWTNPELRGIVFAPTWTPSYTPSLTPTSTPGVTPTPSPTPESTLTPSPTIGPEIQRGNERLAPTPTDFYPPVPERAIRDSVFLLNEGQINRALPTLAVERELVSESFHPNPYYYEALARAMAGDSERALELLEEAEGRLPEVPFERQGQLRPTIDLAFAHVYLVLAQQALEEGAAGEANDYLDIVEERGLAAIEGDRRIAQAYAAVARAYTLQEDYDSALDVLDQGLEVRELVSDVDLIVTKGEVFLRQEEYDAAIYQAYLALYIDPYNENAHLLRVQSALAKDDPGLTVVYIESYVFYHPGSTLGFKLLGDARVLENKLDLALRAYSQALTPEEVTPATLDALLARAAIYDGQGQYDLAFADYDAAFDIAEDPAIQAQRMLAAYNSGNYRAARDDAEALLGTGVLPDGQIQLVLARALIDQAGPNDTDDFQEALNLLQSARGAVPAELQPVASEYLARAYLQLENYGNALDAINDALAGGETGSRHYLRGLILEARGEDEEAVREFDWVVTWGQVYPYSFLPDARDRYEELTNAEE